jgi:hypothetical protein
MESPRSHSLHPPIFIGIVLRIDDPLSKTHVGTTKTTLGTPAALFRTAKAAAARRGQTRRQRVTVTPGRKLGVTVRARAQDCSAVLRSVRQSARSNAASGEAGPDAVGAVGEQRRG